jgi:hypothetical protein
MRLLQTRLLQMRLLQMRLLVVRAGRRCELHAE